MARPKDVAVSAPGKVLFAGGFLVLDRRYTGLVFGLSARIHVLIQGHAGLETETSARLPFNVRSPQFKEARWRYNWSPAEGGELAGKLEQDTTDDAYAKRSNPFVQTTLEYALIYLARLRLATLAACRITILADNSYYSSTPQPGEPRPFARYSVPLHDAHKTGLGSSAALVTALTAALLIYFDNKHPLTTLTDIPFQKRLHNLAQAAHCAAQGKVGSGFDVAAAVYGSCLYRRFSPSILSNLGDSHSPGFGERLSRCVENLNDVQPWDVEISSQLVQIPKSLLLLMCDVDCGSETPGMVKKVLAWRKEKPEEAESLWTALQQGSENLCAELTKLAKLDVEELSMDQLQQLGDIIQNIRSLVREMSGKSGVPIEPPVITELLDYCTDLPGVIGGVAPGAGGYDAVALLVRNDAETVRDLEDRLKGWNSKSKQGSDATIGKVSLLQVVQEWEGIRIEKMDIYAALDWAIE